MISFLRGFSFKSFGAALLVEAVGVVLWAAILGPIGWLPVNGAAFCLMAAVLLLAAAAVGFEKNTDWNLWYLYLRIDGILALIWMLILVSVLTDNLWVLVQGPPCWFCGLTPLVSWMILPIAEFLGLSLLLVAIEDTRLPQSKESGRE